MKTVAPPPRRVNTGAKGRRRELQLVRYLREWGAWATNGSASIYDVIAKRADGPLLLIEVKGNDKGGPYANFRKTDRLHLLAEAKVAGAEAWLCHWPAHKEPAWFHSSEWPPVRLP